jgi:cytoskeletal protein CcmA (bactofilin family)
MTNNPKDAFGGTQVSSKAVACVSQGIKIRGELTGTEDLFIDGTVEGKITLENSVVTVGPNAVVKADITAREVVIRGDVEGKLYGSERIQIWHSAKIHGDMKSERVAIEEGSELHGHRSSARVPRNQKRRRKKQPAEKGRRHREQRWRERIETWDF